MKKINSKLTSKLQSSTQELDIKESPYTITFDSRDLYITDQIDSYSLQPVIESINAINKLDDFESRNYAVVNCDYNPPPINIYINSPGGSAMAALSLITTIENSETPIHTHCIGEASSAALFIFAIGHVRHAYKHSIFMYHQVSANAVGAYKDIEDQVETIKHLQERLEEVFSIYTKFSKEELEDIRLQKKDHTFYYKEALEKGVADKIVLNSIYQEDLKDLDSSGTIDIKDYKSSDKDSKDDDSEISELTEEELKLAITQFIQNKNNKFKD